jgi:hypothetical protein
VSALALVTLLIAAGCMPRAGDSAGKGESYQTWNAHLWDLAQ